MLDLVAKFFTRGDPRRDAKIGLARIISRYEMTGLSYKHGIADERRSRDERYVPMGVWLFPCSETATSADLNLSSGVPAVTHNLRIEGFGVMTPVRLKHRHFVVAVPDENDVWRFFRCDVRHNTARPGHWFLLGLQVATALVLDGEQCVEFRSHTSKVCDAN